MKKLKMKVSIEPASVSGRKLLEALYHGLTDAECADLFIYLEEIGVIEVHREAHGACNVFYKREPTA